MKHNPALPPIHTIDPVLSENTIQTITTQSTDTELVSCTLHDFLRRKNVFAENDRYTQRKIFVEVKPKPELTEKEQKHALYKYPGIIGHGSYIYNYTTKVGAVGSIFVEQPFRGNGYGTAIKTLIDNHLRQDGAKISFTYIASEEGRKLASKTGYSSDTLLYPHTNQMWSKTFSEVDKISLTERKRSNIHNW